MTLRRFLASLRHAVHGLRLALAEENSFRIHVAVAIVVIGVVAFLGLTRVEMAIIIFLISSMLTLELVNTVVERFVDLLEPRVHPYVGVIKDLLAAAVLVTSIAAFIIGCLLLLPYFHFSILAVGD